MARFNLETTQIMDGDGTERTYTVIADRSSFESVDTGGFGAAKIGRGFLRCRGKQFIGTYGRETPVYAGSDAEIYYAPMSFFDGDWRRVMANSRGLYDYVTADSGTGKLFAELEEFAAESNCPICG